MTQMELAASVGYSDAQISRLEQNLRLPDIPNDMLRFITALAIEDESKTVARLLDLLPMSAVRMRPLGLVS
ncbi:MAG: hypothetical protein IPJ46_10515 [Anaerolineales bacterium]|nr:hypothetical protein [Anaerolineales bacterium]